MVDGGPVPCCEFMSFAFVLRGRQTYIFSILIVKTEDIMTNGMYEIVLDLEDGILHDE